VFVIDEKPHPTFTREGNDLIYTHRCAQQLGGQPSTSQQEQLWQ
jgi:hypothetical protein